MKINVVCIGKIKKDYLLEGINDYAKRIERFAKFEIIELAETTFKTEPTESEREIIKEKEGKAIISKLQGTVILLDVGGKMLSSVELSSLIQNIKQRTDKISFVIGGSYGVSEEVKQRADYKISFSKMTFPHAMFRLFLTEQIYRAFMIENNSTYHK